MMNFIKTLFNKEKEKIKSNFDLIKEIPIGIVIKINFKDPRTIGIIDPSSKLTRRYDEEDLKNRILIGTVLTKKLMNDMLFIELGCFKIRNGMRVERTYTLMVEEIEHIEIIK